ncbi:hypothetical protein DYA88_12565 [Vibrio cholerae]|nr:hypothetical protein [Vibrio cholerae]
MTHCLTQIRQVQKRLVNTRLTNLMKSGGPSQVRTGDQAIMSEGQQQPSRAINIETLPRITLISTSKITSPDYPHDFTDVADGNYWV